MFTSLVAPVAGAAPALEVSAAGASAFFSPPHAPVTTDNTATTTVFFIAFQPPSLGGHRWFYTAGPGAHLRAPACEQVHKIVATATVRHGAPTPRYLWSIDRKSTRLNSS